MGRIETKALMQAGLEIMEKNGKPLVRQPGTGRAMLYKMPNGQSVRMRTCNDHILIVLADSPSLDAKLNIEGTDWLLIVMPEIERTQGKIIAHLVPTKEAIEEARRSHKAWLSTHPNTKGDNRTWNLWFQSDGPEKANGYAEKWKKYLLKNSTESISENSESSPSNIKIEVESARQRIAKVAGVSSAAVKITIDFGE